MPSLAAPLFARGVVKKWTNYKYVAPYKELLPPALKDEVSLSKKGDRSTDAVCLQELMVMLSCFKVTYVRKLLSTNQSYNLNLPRKMTSMKSHVLLKLKSTKSAMKRTFAQNARKS